MSNMTLGVLVGNRGFFPDHLCESGRTAMFELLTSMQVDIVAIDPSVTKFGACETLDDARKCAALFDEHRHAIDGILVTLPNFGDEKAIANAIRFSGLDVPVVVHAFRDSDAHMSIQRRRDSFCGKMSVCNNLHQYNIPFSLTSEHTMDPESPAFRADLEQFLGVCRVVRKLRHARIGMIGARPAAFNTVRFSEKLLEQSGISVETLDLHDLIGAVGRLDSADAEVRAKLEALHAYTSTQGIPDAPLDKMARLGVAIDRWMAEQELTATAIQCWTAIEEFFGVVPCTLMSMMSNKLMPSACETDIAGLVGMIALAAAAERPAALLDWNNNYGSDPDKGVLFHCSNLPKDFFTQCRMGYQEIIAGAVGAENTYGTIVGRVKSGPFTFCRISTSDLEGRITGYVGEGSFTDDPLETFGGYGVIHIPEFQRLLRFICEHGFEHHVAATMAPVANILEEALSRYLGWTISRH